MKNRSFEPGHSFLLILACSVLNCINISAQPDSRAPGQLPNIILIVADDMGYGDLGCYGSEMIQTPNIDALADQGMRFTQHYAGSTVCAPSRGSLMTGMHTGHAYVKGNFAMETEGNLPLPDTTVTVAEVLKHAGYHTGVIGKWGLGGPGSVGGPNNQGFDYSYCYLDQRNAHEYYPLYLWENERKVMLDNQDGKNDYSHDLFTQKALRYIREQADNPFFLYLPYTIPHGKYQVPDDSPYAGQDWSQTQKNYAAMITRMDMDIGSIMQLLKDTGLDANTIVFFTSDNGGVRNRAISDIFHSNGIFRGYKEDLYEGGIRVPLVVRWPGNVHAGRVSDHISAFWDFLPTLCELAGVQPPADIDGISFLPELLGENQREHDYLYWEYFKYNYGWQPGGAGPRNNFDKQAVRMGKWKGVRTDVYRDPEGPIRLFDLEGDVEERNDVAGEYPKITEKISGIMKSAHRDTEFFQSESRASARPPNIIIILVDDAGYVDFGFMGSEDLETPRIDELARKGVIFTDAHVSATVCAPSRAGLITGRYQQRFGHECNGTGGDMGTDPAETTLAGALKVAGYKTAAIGKWHLGHPEAYIPGNRGFDEFYGFLGGSRSYFPLEDPNPEQVIRHNREPVQFEGYLTDVFGDKALEYIDQFKDEPFFLYLAFNAVHTPMQAKKEHLEKYSGHPRRELAAMTWSLDENVGKVIDKLEKEGLTEQTLIFFLSDNGGALSNQSSCGPLKGWKGNKYEGGHRVPFFITWPGRIPDGKAFDGLTSSLDVFMTSLHAAGIEKYQGNMLDGKNLLPYITGVLNGDPHTSLYWRKDKMAAARIGDFKLIRLDDYGYRLYDMENDPGEMMDLQKARQEKFTELMNGLAAWEGAMIEPLWLEEDEWNQVTYEIHQALMENRKPKYTDPGEMRSYLKQ